VLNCCVDTYNLCINQGATYSKVFTWWGPVCVFGQLQRGPVNLTGYTGALQIRPYALSTTILYDASSNLVINGPAGQITLTIPASATEDFTWWNGVYDLLLTSADGSYSQRLAQGKVQVSPGVST
jgi:hypothetical protein